MDINIIVVIISSCIVVGLIVSLKKKNKDFEVMVQDYQIEAAASVAKVEDQLKEEKKELVERVKEGYKAELRDIEEYIGSIEKISRTSGEIHTHKILTEIKKKLVLHGEIKPTQMTILANVFIPFTKEDGEVQLTKIDHLVLMNTGIYIINTKDWQGDILYGITKEKAREFSFILDHLYPVDDYESEKTIIFVNHNEDSKGLKVVSADDPAIQVQSGVNALTQLLNDRLDKGHIKPILYFDHQYNNFINFSPKEPPHVFNQMTTLYEFLEKQLMDCENHYSVVQLEKITNMIENANINT